jgi:hypothetical protein
VATKQNAPQSKKTLKQSKTEVDKIRKQQSAPNEERAQGQSSIAL